MPAVLVVGCHSSQHTGYARVMRGLVPRLAELADVTVYGVQACGPSRLAVPEHDARAAELAAGCGSDGFHPGGIADFVEDRRPDVVVVYNDPVVARWYLDALDGSDRVASGATRVFLYVDVVYEGMSQRHVATLNHPLVRGVMTFADRWKRHLRAAGCVKPMRAVPHAVDRPGGVDRVEARRALGLVGGSVGDETVVFLNLNRNTRRKRLDLYAAAAARFMAQWYDERGDLPDAVFLAMSHHESTHDLHAIAMRELGGAACPEVAALAADKILVNRERLSDERVALLHDACDVGVNCAEAEGFGLCAAETARAGRPVIVSAVGGALEVFASRAPTAPPPAYMVHPSAEYWVPDGVDPVGGLAKLVAIEDLARAFRFFMIAENREAYGRRALEHFRAWPSWGDAARDMMDFMFPARTREPPLA